MNDHKGNQPMMMTMHVPSAWEAEQRVRQARQMFARTLSHWAQDSLALRRMQLHRLQWQPQTRTESWSKAA